MKSYETWFLETTGFAPRRWQQVLALDATVRSRCLRLPTGQGKTLGALAAWTWNRVVERRQTWPRRLIWCLPMRSLTEQTAAVARGFLNAACPQDPPKVHVLMGGASRTEWHLFPEENAVIVGTQDMLLSRALNRGFGSYPARWPMEYGGLVHDSLWVFDEVQLMDVGLITCAQLQAFHEEELESAKVLNRRFNPRRHSWWMSATLQEEWLETVETKPNLPEWTKHPVRLTPSELDEAPCSNSKELFLERLDAPGNNPQTYASELGERVVRYRSKTGLTLVICNTVVRARLVYEFLKTKKIGELHLLHSRFRQSEKEQWNQKIISTRVSEEPKVIVSTQVVEAGVDMSAEVLLTEICPWPSLVQRVGRCARYSGEGRVHIVDFGFKDKTSALPYSPEALTIASVTLEKLNNISIRTIETIEYELNQEQRLALYPYSPKNVVLPNDVRELFDTTPDITGSHLDVSRFIREGDERDLLVFWRDLSQVVEAGRDKVERSKIPKPQAQELCRVPFLTAREWLCGKAAKTDRKNNLKSKALAYLWDFGSSEWELVKRSKLIPGCLICVDARFGGYDVENGFMPKSKNKVPSAFVETEDPDRNAEKNDDGHDSDALSIAGWKTLATHSREVVEHLDRICSSVGLDERLKTLLKIAAQWHDLGKVHPAFQAIIKKGPENQRIDYAKAPEGAWARPARYIASEKENFVDERKGFRHELASTLALFEALRSVNPKHPAFLEFEHEDLTENTEGDSLNRGHSASLLEEIAAIPTRHEFDLVAYLIASHHGKVRMSLAPTKADCEHRGENPLNDVPLIRGVQHGDEIPSVNLDANREPLPKLALSLNPARLGFSQDTGVSWVERTQGLYDRYGPSLAWLETLLRAADIRASRELTGDPLLDHQIEEDA